MKKRDIFPLLYQLASPVALMLLGVLLMIHPDTASVLIARLLGWACILAGVGFGIVAIVTKEGTAGKVVIAAVCISLGGVLLRSPLLLAAWIGRLLGILLILRGGRDTVLSRRHGHGQLLAVLVTLVGVVLTVLPMTTSRLVFAVCGAVLLLLGAAMLRDRLKNRRYLDGGDDPNIIDAL